MFTINRCLMAVMLGAAIIAALGAIAAAFPSGQVSAAAYRRSLGVNEIYNSRRSTNQCEDLSEVRYLCEMCAKETKSLRVYTQCCDSADEAQSWCSQFLRYGISLSD
ncbi:unnamed protein product [Meganyctiphanes norvegica]|uniref:Secreted protein n=1 Tax=Meganyctiphanes norvegica TaxID=48144 RepID=A0AAV2Q137_MEGNR